MSPYLTLLTSFLMFAFATGLLFLAMWAAWAAPARIRGAVRAKWSPRLIRASVKTTYVYWLLMFLAAAAVAGLFAYLCWLYLGVWLERQDGSWNDQLATMLDQTFWAPHFAVGTPDQQPAADAGIHFHLIPFGVIICILLGVYAGSLLGAWLGIKLAAQRFLITKKMF